MKITQLGYSNATLTERDLANILLYNGFSFTMPEAYKTNVNYKAGDIILYTDENGKKYIMYAKYSTNGTFNSDAWGKYQLLNDEYKLNVGNNNLIVAQLLNL